MFTHVLAQVKILLRKKLKWLLIKRRGNWKDELATRPVS